MSSTLEKTTTRLMLASVGADTSAKNVEIWMSLNAANDTFPLYCKLVELAQAEEREASYWQPIESAPKDGTSLLGYWLGGKHECCIHATKFHCGRWWATNEDYQHSTPDYWMPFPAAPKAEVGMNNIFIIADTHFGHKKIAGMRGFETIEEHDAYLVAAWNTTVGKKDTVWHLGDVLFGQASFETLGKLNGIKKLVMGNHDRYPCAKYLEHFNEIRGCVVIDNCLLSHIPIHPSQLNRWCKNIHGHLHDDSVWGDDRYVCVSAEQTDLRPILLKGLTK